MAYPFGLLRRIPCPDLDNRPRSLELFTSLRIIEDVMKSTISTLTVRLYKMLGGRETAHEFEMSPHRNPTPTNPSLNPVMLGQGKLRFSTMPWQSMDAPLSWELNYNRSSKPAPPSKSKLSNEDSHKTQIATNCRSPYSTGLVRMVRGGVVRKQLGLAFLGETMNVANFVVGDICVEGLFQEVVRKIYGAAP